MHNDELEVYFEFSPLISSPDKGCSITLYQDCGMPGAMLAVLVLAVTLLEGAAGSWPVVTWHGAGGTMAECDQMIATIR